MKRKLFQKGAQLAAVCLCAATMLNIGTLQAQVDPGPRPGAAGAGPPVPTLTADEKAFWKAGQTIFEKTASVSGTLPGEPLSGLGPTFNGNSCIMCHSQPAVGGSSTGLTSPQSPMPNPQVLLASLDGAANTVPPFITNAGPIREARFVQNPNGTLDGGVHDLYTISGRSDDGGCGLAQPNFAAAIASNNIIFRIPTPTFGLGFVENTPDATLQTNLGSNAAAKTAAGIFGRLNSNGNDGTVTRFGWKAQNKSLLIFAGEATNVELGIANDNFTNERSAIPGCVFNPTPEDTTQIHNPNGGGLTGTANEMSSLIVNFGVAFMRLNAVPVPAASTPSTINGQMLFDIPANGGIGCALCHTQNLTTAASPLTGMGNFTYQPFSDFALHHMGSGLADGVTQGAAGPDEFRTAPLWGVGQRLFFLHDGRTSDLLTAIRAHSAPITDCVNTSSLQVFKLNGQIKLPVSSMTFCGSEANTVINRFNVLSPSQQQDILNFLRSL